MTEKPKEGTRVGLGQSRDASLKLWAAQERNPGWSWTVPGCQSKALDSSSKEPGLVLDTPGKEPGLVLDTPGMPA